MQVPTDPEGDFVADNGYPQRVRIFRPSYSHRQLKSLAAPLADLSPKITSFASGRAR